MPLSAPVHSTPVLRRASAPPGDEVINSPVLPTKRPRGRPRKDGRPAGSVPPRYPRRPPANESVTSASEADSATDTPRLASEQPADADNPFLTDANPPKRKRGRPRKYPITPSEESARAAAKASQNIPPWSVVEAVDRPPVYPETHILLGRHCPPRPSSWTSPERARPARPPRWHYYRRPVRTDLQGKRRDGVAPEPIPPAPPGRRGRTRVDYTALLHWQFVCRARGEQLDAQTLWRACVRRWHAEHGLEYDDEEYDEDEYEVLSDTSDAAPSADAWPASPSERAERTPDTRRPAADAPQSTTPPYTPPR